MTVAFLTGAFFTGAFFATDFFAVVIVDSFFTGSEATVALSTKTKGANTREWKKRDVTVVERGACVDDDDGDCDSECELDVEL